MRFFLLDFALAFVALLGYRALAAVTRDRVPAVSLVGRPHPQPARNPEITRAGQRIEPEPVLRERPLKDDLRFCQSVDGTIACGERPPHRLINFW
jgi:hypothetical protein